MQDRSDWDDQRQAVLDSIMSTEGLAWAEAMVRRYDLSRVEGVDLQQTAWESAFKSFARQDEEQRFETIHNPKGYARRTLRNKAVDLLKLQRRRPEAPLLESDDKPIDYDRALAATDDTAATALFEFEVDDLRRAVWHRYQQREARGQEPALVVAVALAIIDDPSGHATEPDDQATTRGGASKEDNARYEVLAFIDPAFARPEGGHDPGIRKKKERICAYAEQLLRDAMTMPREEQG